MKCLKCNADVSLLINSRCPKCKPFNACPKCKTGDLVGKPEPHWMNQMVCNACGHKCSR